MQPTVAMPQHPYYRLRRCTFGIADQFSGPRNAVGPLYVCVFAQLSNEIIFDLHG